MEGDNYFSIIPEWVLDGPVSATAVRLYCVLQRYANSHGKCYPSRSLLAQRCQISVKSVDRAIDELSECGALQVQRRKTDKGDWTSNIYTVITADPKRVGTKTTLPSDKNDTTGSVRNDPQTKAIVNESQRTKSKASANTEAARQLCSAWWEAQNPKPLGNWNGLNLVVRKALDAGYPPDRVRQALDKIGQVPSAQQLERELKGVGQSKYDRNRRQLEENHQRLKEEARQQAVMMALNASKKGEEE